MESKAPYSAVPALPTVAPSGFIDIRSNGGKLIFRLDCDRWLISWRERDGKDSALIDLTEYLIKK